MLLGTQILEFAALHCIFILETCVQSFFVYLSVVQLSGNQLITVSYRSHIKKNCIVAFDWYKLVQYIFWVYGFQIISLG